MWVNLSSVDSLTHFSTTEFTALFCISLYIYPQHLIPQTFIEGPFVKHHTRYCRPDNELGKFHGLMEQYIDLWLNKG